MKSRAAASLNSVEISNTFPHPQQHSVLITLISRLPLKCRWAFIHFAQVQRLLWRVSTCHQAALDHSICPEISETPGQTSGHSPISQPELANPVQILQLQVPSSAQTHICSAHPLPRASSQWQILFPQDHNEGEKLKPTQSSKQPNEFP